MVKRDGVILEKTSLTVRKDGVILEKTSLTVRKDGVILEERYCNEEPNKIKHHRIQHNSKDLRHQRNPRALNPPDRTGLRICVISAICGT